MPVIFFDGIQLIGLSILALLFSILGALVMFIRLNDRYRKWRSGECYKHTAGELLDVASVGGGSKHRCTKCGKGFWK
jgi:hypothetical protein